jgi:hypothetical protein
MAKHFGFWIADFGFKSGQTIKNIADCGMRIADLRARSRTQGWMVEHFGFRISDCGFKGKVKDARLDGKAFWILDCGFWI